mmetsp:Transcript_89551/g.187086  ORF Transcript_89551/g.187086 Transcript_89551/m.187086 type:complete len:378 (+) Transcript_89551:242-1375(+)|eukprot:CAMPEP_0206438922 /NCGR_PEP_ID=MMETSP0324_2-20121206/11916_1 /ASSEMBLY_ACC=CAM_ASM_000836 /TAXON_ID=2866 /ORGANISM="Crypthecodinium cohnii, Strain Seligo" /LENGTH=377 /DNA_ID=CAMNT_0053906469 /DNA_START=213 /DNA_END=1346 /DNA_ORIENTATION=+
MTAPSVHGALLLTQLCWGSAAVVNKLGLSGAGISPLLFALIRELTATPLLILLLLWGRRQRNRGRRERNEAPKVEQRSCSRIVLRILPGFFIFVDQLCSLTGVTLADGVTGAAWQPSQVVFTLMISVCLGMEILTPWKVISMLLTVAGALCLVFLGGHEGGAETGKDYYLVGQLFFCFNCLASSMEVIVWRKLLSTNEGEEGSHFAVMAESYLVAACFMVVANVFLSFSPAAVDFLCPKCNGDPWHVPGRALYAITYSVIFQTIIAYVCQAWALRFAPASLASLYATAQPIMAALVTVLLLIIGFNPSNLLHWPGLENVGAFFIIAGLLVAEYGSRRNAGDLAQQGATPLTEEGNTTSEYESSEADESPNPTSESSC